MESDNELDNKEDREHLLSSIQKSAMNDMDKYLRMYKTIDIHDDNLSKSSSIDLDLIENNEDDELIPTTNITDKCIEISTESVYENPKNNFQILGSSILYKYTTILICKQFEKNFIQSTCASIRGSLVVLPYLESMLFPSIF